MYAYLLQEIQTRGEGSEKTNGYTLCVSSSKSYPHCGRHSALQLLPKLPVCIHMSIQQLWRRGYLRLSLPSPHLPNSPCTSGHTSSQNSTVSGPHLYGQKILTDIRRTNQNRFRSEADSFDRLTSEWSERDWGKGGLRRC